MTTNSDFIWGQEDKATNKKVVAMTQMDATALAALVAKAVTEQTDKDKLEQYRQMARMEIDLAELRRDTIRKDEEFRQLREYKDEEIRQLREHINRLNDLLSNAAPAPATVPPYFSSAALVIPPLTIIDKKSK